MFSLLSTSQIWTIVIITILFYLLIVAFVYGKRYWVSDPKTSPASTTSIPSGSLIGPVVAPLVSPVANLSASAPVFQPIDSDENVTELEEPSFVDEEIPFVEEQQTTLLKEAEQVVERIQDVVDHIASRPANPEEVFTKIQAIVSEYSFFFDTEYYDAINRFVAVTVQRDCDLLLAEEDLKALWYAAAA